MKLSFLVMLAGIFMFAPVVKAKSAEPEPAAKKILLIVKGNSDQWMTPVENALKAWCEELGHTVNSFIYADTDEYSTFLIANADADLVIISPNASYGGRFWNVFAPTTPRNPEAPVLISNKSSWGWWNMTNTRDGIDGWNHGTKNIRIMKEAAGHLLAAGLGNAETNTEVAVVEGNASGNEWNIGVLGEEKFLADAIKIARTSDAHCYWGLEVGGGLRDPDTGNSYPSASRRVGFFIGSEWFAGTTGDVKMTDNAKLLFHASVKWLLKDQLKKTINSVTAFVAGTIVGTETGEYPQSARDAVDAVITSATTTLNTDVAQSVVDAAVTDLTAALTTYQNAVNTPMGFYLPEKITYKLAENIVELSRNTLIKVYNAVGIPVIEITSDRVDINGLAKGVYIISFVDLSGNKVSFKVAR